MAEVTKEVTGDDVIWARSAWAGSQRYPLHWGGDAENTDSAMAAELRGGLSFGLSGFTYWSHDVGGFVNRAPRDLYRRWLAWGVLTSHTRAHGAPPREPWEYDEALTEDFRKALGLRYSLMPYIYAQAKDSSARGFPLVRPLFFEYPNDPGSWTIEDEYMFGSDLLVAPMFATGERRKVYLPPVAGLIIRAVAFTKGRSGTRFRPVRFRLCCWSGTTRCCRISRSHRARRIWIGTMSSCVCLVLTVLR